MAVTKRKAADDAGDGGRAAGVDVDVSGRDLSALATDGELRAALFGASSPPPAIDRLDASACRLGPGGIARLLSLLASDLPTSARPRRLILRRNAAGSSGGRVAGEFLRRDDAAVARLDLGSNDLRAGSAGPIAADALSDALLASDSSLRALILDKCALGPEGASSLARGVASNASLTELELGGNMIGPVGGEALFRALASNASLERLGMRMNRIGGGGSARGDVRALGEALASGTCRLARLDLSYNDLRCGGCRILSHAILDARCTLTELLLEKNDISQDGATALADALSSNGTLRALVLRGNAIGDGGASALGSMLTRNASLQTLDVSSCSIGNRGGAALGRGLAGNASLERLLIDKNWLGAGDDPSFFSVGVASANQLRELSAAGNGIGASGDAEAWGASAAAALSNGESSPRRVDLSNNALSEPSVVDAAASRPSLERADLSDNEFEEISIETQLILSERLAGDMRLDLSLNPLSSPPLGRLADHDSLRSYLTLLASEKTAVTRIRVMVLGHGGAGKSTFCRAVTAEGRDVENFESGLVPVPEWGVELVADWAGKLGTRWAGDAVRLVRERSVSGEELGQLIDRDDGDGIRPSKLLLDLCSSKYQPIDAHAFARAISALLAKGYLSTVGAVKVEGTIALDGGRTCSLVDFAGQVEFLVTHQLLLSSMHTMCMIVQPAPAFGRVWHRHSGSWDYWSRFLASLGDRRQGSLLLAASQLDKLRRGEDGFDESYTTANIQSEFDAIKRRSLGAISCEYPLLLDYRPGQIADAIATVKRALTTSTERIARSWWVPLTYETLGEVIRQVAERKTKDHELPILTREELMHEMDGYCNRSHEDSTMMAKMKADSQLLQRAISYLEAVGDVMQAGDGWILIDPIGWFSSFLAHFIKDDLAVSTIQVDSASLRSRKRGTINLDEIVVALKHEYQKPQQHVAQIMMVLCSLELCVPLKATGHHPQPISYLFPCLLPPLMSQSELRDCELLNSANLSASWSLRAHRFRESSRFIPPGLFVGILARMYRHLQHGAMHPARMWKDLAVMEFNNGTTFVLLRLDLGKAIIDVIGWAPQNESMFVGAAKGQASIVVWIVHLIKALLHSYSQLKFEESWLCPNPVCHGFDSGLAPSSAYCGSEFLLKPKRPGRSKFKSHDCSADGCWRFLGTGHKLESIMLETGPLDECQPCASCNIKPTFTLRDKIA
ncbi:hypothetical protein ACHAWF_014130 [Thalassiosira exigua]